MNILESTQKRSGKTLVLLMLLLCIPANLLIACNNVSKTDNQIESKLEVEVNNNLTTTANEGITLEIVASVKNEVVNANVEKMRPILRAVTGFILENKSYNSANNSTYWMALDTAANEYIRIYGKAVAEGSFYKVSPQIIEELSYVLFPNRVDYEKVVIPTFSNIKYARYDQTEHIYYIAQGTLGGVLCTEIGNITNNDDGSLTVTVNATSASIEEKDWKETFSFTLIKNEKAAESHFAYAIKDVTWLK